MSHNKLGLWCGKRLNSAWSWSIALVVALGSIRGLLVIHFDISPLIVYRLTAACLLSLAIYGWITRGWFKDPNLIWLKNLLKLNLLLGTVNVAIDAFLGAPPDFSVLYLYLAPYVVFLFLRVPSFYFNVAIIVITIAISASVTGNFVESLKGPEGWNSVVAYNTKLRPDVPNALGKSRTGDFYRASGYTGNPHDSANILGMVVSFFFIRFLLKKRVADLGLSLLALVSMTMTQSATNILVAIFTLICFTAYIMIRSRKKSTYIYLFFALAVVAGVIASYGDIMDIFMARIEGGDWEGMTRSLNMASLFSASPFLLAGHAYAFGSKAISTEIAFLKTVLQLGIVHAAIVFGMMLYPLFRLVKSRPFCIDALPSAAAIFFGFMSLLHYGSVFRVTSVFLFFVFFAICLSHIINAKEAIFKTSESIR